MFMAETFETPLDSELCWNDIWFQDGVLDIPEGIQMQLSHIHSETTEAHREHLRSILDNYIRSTIDISSGNEILDTLIVDEILKNMLIGMHESRYSLNTIDLQEGRDIFLRSALERFSREFPEEYVLYDVIWNFEIIFWDERVSLENYLLPEASLWEQDREASLAPISSFIPPLRPNFHPEYIKASREYWHNQYETLQGDGFSPSMRNFLQQDFIPRLLWEDVLVTEEHMERIQKFLCFLIDIETSWGTQLINGVSTATGYTQTLNESEADRETGRYNSIDTRLRTAVMFYNNWDITRGSRNGTLNIPDSLPRAQWIWDLWEYNSVARNMNTFSFESELRLTLIYLASQNPDAMLSLLHWENESESAQLLYHTHHTNVWWQENTQIVMMQKILKHYS
jgi:hypothetical protein